jgi:hypothetical protein
VLDRNQRSVAYHLCARLLFAGFLELTRMKYVDQAKWYLNGFWGSAEKEAENIWKMVSVPVRRACPSPLKCVLCDVRRADSEVHFAGHQSQSQRL